MLPPSGTLELLKIVSFSNGLRVAAARDIRSIIIFITIVITEALVV